MHAGVQHFIRWVHDTPERLGISLEQPATVADLALVEDDIAAPLPADLRLLLTRFNGAALPTGHLLSAGRRAPQSIREALHDLAQRLQRSSRDPELILPFFRAESGAVLAFDRSAGPVADTWPIVDYDLETGELRLVHRTLDGWCRMCVGEWTAGDFAAEFTLSKYLAAGQRHAEIEPDVSIAHATVAHALRRCGEPEQALASYLRAARCVPAQPWCDWEALKLAVLLGERKKAMEAVSRLSTRAPAALWRARESTPGNVADVVARIAELGEQKEALLRVLDQLAGQASSADEHTHITSVRRALFNEQLPPASLPVRPTAVPPMADPEAFWQAVRAAYQRGEVREEDLLLDPSYRPLAQQHDFVQLLRLRREF